MENNTSNDEGPVDAVAAHCKAFHQARDTTWSCNAMKPTTNVLSCKPLKVPTMTTLGRKPSNLP